MSTTTNSMEIKATPEKVYHAFTDPVALQSWLVPGEMNGKLSHFDLRIGGGYEMSLFYPPGDKSSMGKTTANEDRYTARFLELVPNRKIVQSSQFDTTDASFAGEMIMDVTLQENKNSTTVIVTFTNIPPGISPEDNKKGTQLSLEKLADYIS